MGMAMYCLNLIVLSDQRTFGPSGLRTNEPIAEGPIVRGPDSPIDLDRDVTLKQTPGLVDVMFNWRHVIATAVEHYG